MKSFGVSSKNFQKLAPIDCGALRARFNVQQLIFERMIFSKDAYSSFVSKIQCITAKPFVKEVVFRLLRVKKIEKNHL